MSTQNMAHVNTKHGPCQHKTWPMSTQNMAHVNTKHGPCQHKTWPMSTQNMAHVNTKHGPCQHKTWPMSTQNIPKHTKKIKLNEKYKNKNKMCRAPNLLYLLYLISNTLPQLEQSSLQPSTVLHHRHLLQTTCYNHLLLPLHLLISRKEKNQAATG